MGTTMDTGTTQEFVTRTLGTREAGKQERHKCKDQGVAMEMCEIEATVASGLEWVAKEEVWKRLGLHARTEQGRVLLHLPISQVEKVLELRCVDHLYVVILRKEVFDFASDLQTVIHQMEDLVLEADWSVGLEVWSKFTDYRCPVSPHPQEKWTEIKQRVEQRRKHLRHQPESDCMELHSVGEGNNTQQNYSELRIAEIGDTQEECITLKTSPEDGMNHGKCSESNTGGNCDTQEDFVKYEAPHCHEPLDERNGLNCNLNTDQTDGRPSEIIDMKSCRDQVRTVNMCNTTQQNGCTTKHQACDSEQANCGGSLHTCLNLKKSADEVTERHRENDFNPSMPRFRATCYRAGTGHCFQSQEVARCLGGRMQDYFGWNVDLKEHDLETVLNIHDKRLYLCIALTKRSRHFRNIVDHAKVTLRPTICAAMLRMCRLKPGDVVCDPMCGTASIPIEGMLGHPATFHVGGELQKIIVRKARKNVTTFSEDDCIRLLSADILKWDVQNLPLRDGSVDVVVTDLPFGKRSGSKAQNWTVYPAALSEMARVTRPEGRACLLTQDKKCMLYTLKKLRHLWLHGNTVYINHGGMKKTALYLLKRTVKGFD